MNISLAEAAIATDGYTVIPANGGIPFRDLLYIHEISIATPVGLAETVREMNEHEDTDTVTQAEDATEVAAEDL